MYFVYNGGYASEKFDIREVVQCYGTSGYRVVFLVLLLTWMMMTVI